MNDYSMGANNEISKLKKENKRLFSVNRELVEALEMELWAIDNGEAESQKQGKPRYSERHEIIFNLINKHK